MKKIYETPAVEVSKFSLAADILTASDLPENDLNTREDFFSAGSGFGM